MTKFFTLAHLAEITQSELIGNPLHLIKGVEDLENATDEEASFLANPRYENQMRSSRAGVICIHPHIVKDEKKNYLINEDPSRVFQKIVELFNPSSLSESGFFGIHPSAVIHEKACLGENVTIGPNVVIDRDAKVGSGTKIAPNVSIGPNVEIGENCTIHSNVVIRESCKIGSRVIIQPGAVIGSCGFGYTTDQKGHHSSLKQVGKVILEDDVEIGANTCIDRARFKTTIVKKGTKVDNLVQIAHGVEIGEHNLIVSQSGIAGSSKTGRNVVLAGQSALVGHITLGDGVILGARGAASKSLPTGIYNGAPAVPNKEYHEQIIFTRNLKKYVKKIEELEKKLKELTEKS